MSADKNSTTSAHAKRARSTGKPSKPSWQSVKRFVETVMRHELGVACVDLDSVLLHHLPEFGTSRLGRALPLGRKLTWLLHKHKFKVVVLTARPGLYNHGVIHAHLLSLGFALDRVTNVKPPADAYFDDKAFRVPKNWR